MNTLQQLQVIMPGQPIAWYERIAAEIDAGRMPMPSVSMPSSEPQVSTKPSDSQFISRSQIPSRLVKLCGNQRSVAESLIRSRLKDFPDKSIEWCVKHVILDFERSRR